MTLTKRERALGLLGELFDDRQRIEIAEAVDRAAALGVSRRTLQRAAAELGIRAIHSGNDPGFWEVPKGRKTNG